MRSQERRATALYCTENRRRQMKTNDIATDLGRVFTVARDNALMGGVVIGDMVDRLYAVHNALKTKHASGELTDGQYTEKANELLGMLDRLGDIMTELVTEPPRCKRRSYIAGRGRSR